MNAKDVIRATIQHANRVVDAYLADLSDEDIKFRPVEGMNSIAWQLGHLIAAQAYFLEAIRPGSAPPLPAGFAEVYDRGGDAKCDPSKYLTKAGYRELLQAQRTATDALIESLPEDQLDLPGPERLASIAPRVGDLLNLIGTHPLMHVGQWVATRRALGKPTAI